MKPLLPILIVAFVAAVGYGISFPLLGYRLEQLSVPGWMVGINSATPAFGWVLGSAVIPMLQLRFRVPIGVLALVFLLSAAVAACGLRYSDAFWSMTILRFFFGGGMGLFFRSVEYWINALSPDAARARNLSINGIALMVGLVVGSAVQPSLGWEGWVPFGCIIATIGLAIVLLPLWPNLSPPNTNNTSLVMAIGCISAIPVAFAAALAYGLYESVPAYLNQIYALRNNMDSHIAAYALTAAALGNILLPLPIAMFSDKVGRIAPLAGCALICGAVALLIPATLTNSTIFLIAVGVCAGTAGTVYGLGLAIVGDRFQDAQLVTANAAFGLVYATGSIFGPLINGAALDTMNSHGLVVSSTVIFAALLVALCGLGRRHGRAASIDINSA